MNHKRKKKIKRKLSGDDFGLGATIGQSLSFQLDTPWAGETFADFLPKLEIQGSL